jgi:hypothetical protein
MLLESSFTVVVGTGDKQPITLPVPGFAGADRCEYCLLTTRLPVELVTSHHPCPKFTRVKSWDSIQLRQDTSPGPWWIARWRSRSGSAIEAATHSLSCPAPSWPGDRSTRLQQAQPAGAFDSAVPVVGAQFAV